MDVVLPTTGRYVVAVSGGVDSVALLDILATAAKQNPVNLQLVVAHFDHGIRKISSVDRELVQQLAKNYELPFKYAEGQLGPKASEATARAARYDFLREVQSNTGSTAIITAHHRDDVIETAVLNLLRGTGRKGLTSLASNPDLLRPLLGITKNDIIAYAKSRHLEWNEDSTNTDQAYRRNYVRHGILADMNESKKQQLWEIIVRQEKLNRDLDVVLADQLQLQLEGGRLDRSWFVQLPHKVAREIMASYLRAHGISDFDTKTLERLVVASKVARPGRQFDILHGSSLRVYKDYLALEGAER